MISNWNAASIFSQQLLDFLVVIEGKTYYAKDIGDGKVTIGTGFNISDTTVRGYVYARLGLTANPDSLANTDAIVAETEYKKELDKAINSYNIAALDGIMARRA